MNKVKIHLINWEKTFAVFIAHKWIMSLICKDLFKIKERKPKTR